MSGKGAGKKRNRAAQSLQHGYQEHPEDVAGKTKGKETGHKSNDGRSDRQRIMDQLRELEEQRRESEE